MDEKILIKGNATALKLVPTIVVILGLIVGIGLSNYVVEISEDYLWPFTIGGGAILIVWGIVLFFYVNSCEICVTDRRIYGKAAFGAAVSIPKDSVTAVGTIALFKGISVGSSSGTIKFLYISNADEIYRTINDLLIERQSSKRQ